MADKNAITITISGETKDLEKALQNAVNGLNKVTQAATDQNKQMSKGAKDTSASIIDEFKNIKNLSTGSFSALAENFISFALNPMTLAAGGAAAAIIGAFSLAKIGEENNKIAANFKFIAEQAGLNADALKEKLAGAAEGYADLEDVLPIAADSVLKLGKNAQSMGELFELSKNIALRTGKDVTQVFQDITNGVARQNEKILLANGIQLDSATIIKRYAEANGIAKERLSDAAKQQAILNEVLSQGKKKFGETGAEIAPIEGGTRRLALAMDDLKDAFAAIVNSKLGETFARIADGTAIGIKAVADFFTVPQGSDAIRERIQAIKDEMKGIKENKILYPEDVDFFNKQLNEANNKLLALQKVLLENEKIKKEGTAPKDLTTEEKTIAETPEERQARLDKINEIEAQQREVEVKAKLDHQAALQQIEDSGGTYEEKAAAKLALQQEYDNAEFESQVLKNQKIKDEDEKAAQNRLAVAKKSAKDQATLDAADVQRKKDETEAKKQIEANLWATSYNLAANNAEATKALQVAQAIRNTYEGATLALAKYPPPFGAIAAATTVALGLSQVAKITGAADGALVTGGAGSKTDDQPFMLSRGELVAPAKTFDEVVEGTAKERGYVKQGENNTDALLQQILDKLQTPTIIVNSDFLTDDNSINKLADRLREAVQFRGATLA